jgi:hypothetical protein
MNMMPNGNMHEGSHHHEFCYEHDWGQPDQRTVVAFRCSVGVARSVDCDAGDAQALIRC